MDIFAAGGNFNAFPPKNTDTINTKREYPIFKKELFDAFDYTINEIPTIKSVFNSYGAGFKTIKEYFLLYPSGNDKTEHKNNDNQCWSNFSYDAADKNNPIFNAQYHLPNAELYVTYAPAENRTTSHYKENGRDVQIITSYFAKDNNCFYEQMIVPVSNNAYTETKLTVYKDEYGLCNLKNAEIIGTLVKNKKICLKITDIYDENQNVKFKQIEFFFLLPKGEKITKIKYKFIKTPDNILDLSEVMFNDINGKTWIERYIYPADESLDKFYKLPPKHTKFHDKKDNATIFVPYIDKDNGSIDYFIQKSFNCNKSELMSWLLNNFKIVNDNGIINLPAVQVQNAGNLETY